MKKRLRTDELDALADLGLRLRREMEKRLAPMHVLTAAKDESDLTWEDADEMCQGDPDLERICRAALQDVKGGLRACRAVVHAVARAYKLGRSRATP